LHEDSGNMKHELSSVSWCTQIYTHTHTYKHTHTHQYVLWFTDGTQIEDLKHELDFEVPKGYMWDGEIRVGG